MAQWTKTLKDLVQCARREAWCGQSKVDPDIFDPMDESVSGAFVYEEQVPNFPTASAAMARKEPPDKSPAKFVQSGLDTERTAAPEDLELEELPELDVGAGSKYKGQWRGQQWHGYGTFSRPNGQIYQGQFVENRAHGRGKLKAPNGSTYDGEWVEDRAHGFGKYVHADQSVYSG